MAVIRLELEVDSEVYPELHAALEAVRNSASRGERLRQLAATGLVWETVRVHGASVAGLQGAAKATPNALVPVSGNSVWVADSGVRHKPEEPHDKRAQGKRAAETRPSEPRGSEKRASRPGDRNDFIDLALNAVPLAEAPSDAPTARAQAEEAGRPPLHIPLLLDIVNPLPQGGVRLPGDIADRRGPHETDSETDAAAADAGASDSAGHGTVHKPGVRSRLVRMKEMGLFKNG